MQKTRCSPFGKGVAKYVAGSQCAGNSGNHVLGKDVGEGVGELACGESVGGDGVTSDSEMLAAKEELESIAEVGYTTDASRSAASR